MGEGGFNAEMGGRIGFMISDSAEKVMVTLLDANNLPVWVPSHARRVSQYHWTLSLRRKRAYGSRRC